MTDDRREWFIYVLRDPRDNEVRYVGFTIDVVQRFRVHISEAIRGIIKSHKNNWINVLANLHLQPVMEVIERGTGEWQSVEQYWIRHYRMQGARLTNSTDGGDGVLGRKQSPEAIEKTRQANLGRKLSFEHIEKMRQANLGRKHTPEAIEKMTGRKHSPEAIEKIRQANLGRKNSPEHIEKARQASLGRKHSPEAIEKRRQAHIGSKHSPEAIEKMRQASKKTTVRRIEDGMIFASLSDAARSVDRGPANIFSAITTRGKCAGYHWERVGETPPADPYTLDGNALVMRFD